MCSGLIGVHPLKLGDFSRDPLSFPGEGKSAHVFDVFRERNLRPREQAHRSLGLSHRGETASEGTAKIG